MKSLKKISILTALFAFLLSFTFSSSYAQVKEKMQPKTFALQGKVVNAQSAEVLADAEIMIVGQDVTTVSNQDGVFKLENLPAAQHTLKVTLDGYQTWEKNITLDENLKLTVKLKPKK